MRAVSAGQVLRKATLQLHRQPALLAQLVLLPWVPARPCGQDPRTIFEHISVLYSTCKAMDVEVKAEASCHGDEQGRGNVRALKNRPHHPHGFGPSVGMGQPLLMQHQSKQQSHTFISTGYQTVGSK